MTGLPVAPAEPLVVLVELLEPAAVLQPLVLLEPVAVLQPLVLLVVAESLLLVGHYTEQQS
jgi:hypothetical protein